MIFTEEIIFNSWIYIRYRIDGTVTYVGQTKTIGRAFRKIIDKNYDEKFYKVRLIKCPENRLNVREAYFILKLRPDWVFNNKGKKLFTSYYEKAKHLLKKLERQELKQFTSEFQLKELLGYKETNLMDEYRKHKKYIKKFIMGLSN
jgi:hypothetical protein